MTDIDLLAEPLTDSETEKVSSTGGKREGGSKLSQERERGYRVLRNREGKLTGGKRGGGVVSFHGKRERV